eukprot:11209167-Lingulodinium_polyedra.AAC.1
MSVGTSTLLMMRPSMSVTTHGFDCNNASDNEHSCKGKPITTHCAESCARKGVKKHRSQICLPKRSGSKQ